ncbi:1129_t:CDS:2 [Diversispora eburnea]|uniref:1129_t:CDS:1 n=1 Tax=Diversispora eburnea TaxID=1213867 RepID=A0A9N9GEP3_9GLOM|nr:1129_t:CDS:2 [Diversispora eburnea]
MANTQSKVDTLEEQNSKLIAEIAKLRKKNAKLKQIIKENEKRDVRVEELEQKNIELETRLAILEQGKEEKSISTEDVLYSPVKSNDTLKQIVLQYGESKTCGYTTDTPVSDITDDTLNSNDTSEQAVLQNKDAPTSDIFNNVSNSDEYQSQVSNSSLTIPPICKLLQSNEVFTSQVQNLYSDSSPKSHDELHVKQISESQSIPNTFNLSEESSEQNTDLQKTKIPEINIQPLIEELRIEPLTEDTVKVVNVEEITSWYQYRKHFEKRLDDILSENQRNDKRAYNLVNKIRLSLYRAYTEETGLNHWIKSETPESPQIEKTDNHLSQDCIIKISKFPEEKGIIHDALHKRFPFLSYTKSNTWYRDVFKYTNSEAKCPICDEVHTRLGIWDDWSCLGTNDHYFLNCPFRIDQKKVIIAIQSPETQVRVPNKISNSPIHPNKTRLYQYAIEHKMDPEKFSVITEAEKNRWAMGCFRADLKRDIRLYRGGIKRNEDTRKYHKFLTDRDRLVGEELLRRGILKSGLSTTRLDELMKEWEKIHTQFIQIFG